MLQYLGPDIQAAFDKMHVLMVADALAAYPDHSIKRKCFPLLLLSISFEVCSYVLTFLDSLTITT
ncbi:hypothetical protein ACHAW6_008939 [Cyclotella cf. meneghiniana]